MQLRDGPSSIDHVPRARISARFNDEGEGGQVFIDDWKSGVPMEDSGTKEIGWTCFLEKIPDSLMKKQKIRSSSTRRALAEGG